MFTGIIEVTGTVASIHSQGNNKTFWIESPLSTAFKVDQSVSHNGVCLTVEEIKENSHRVTAIEQTLQKSNLESWKSGTLVNLERSLQLNERIDGHLVQGHIDTVGRCISVTEREGSWQFRFSFPDSFSHLVIEKGSIAINGISLTVFNVGSNEFEVAVIPYTYTHTNIRIIEEGMLVNLEFDMFGKYVNRLYELSKIRARQI